MAEISASLLSMSGLSLVETGSDSLVCGNVLVVRLYGLILCLIFESRLRFLNIHSMATFAGGNTVDILVSQTARLLVLDGGGHAVVVKAEISSSFRQIGSSERWPRLSSASSTGRFRSKSTSCFEATLVLPRSPVATRLVILEGDEQVLARSRRDRIGGLESDEHDPAKARDFVALLEYDCHYLGSTDIAWRILTISSAP